MTTPPAALPVVTVVTAPACHFCEDAKQALTTLSEQAPMHIRIVDIDSDEGRALIGEHRPAMNPLVLLDGRYFSAGRLPRKKLAKELRGRAPTRAN
ncbi:glutaredoxin family protein [Cellulomonas sp. ACRRI]|uniref:glutaredoxin family protein n=1 Tax=Cellulomonas sp. ACRRI TaxID=2918188 RepID=UPI001EF27E25|nr:glutaredoxin family protein [Cellulomonas sp. ACRRI]MCG7284742.1 glutaredoxin family protein [Cellulomonas sp. ACRRI]